MAEKYRASPQNKNFLNSEDGFLSIFTLIFIVFLVGIIGINASGQIWRQRQAQMLRNKIQLEAYLYSGIMMEDIFVEHLSNNQPFLPMVSFTGENRGLGYTFDYELSYSGNDNYKMNIEVEDIINEKKELFSYYTDNNTYE